MFIFKFKGRFFLLPRHIYIHTHKPLFFKHPKNYVSFSLLEYNVYFHYQNQSYQIMSYYNYDFEIFDSYMQSKQTLPLMVNYNFQIFI
jgi:hypothetical protein